MKKYAIIDNTQWIYSYPEQSFEEAKAYVEYLKKKKNDCDRRYEIFEWEGWFDLLVYVIQKTIDAYKADVKLEISAEDVIYLEGRLEESVVSMIIDSGEKQTVNDSKVIRVIPGVWSVQKAIGEVKSLCSIVDRLV